MKTLLSCIFAAGLAVISSHAHAQSQGDFLIGVGVHGVLPTDDFSTTAAGLVRVDDNVRPTITAEYFVADRVGIELLAAWPFEHDAQLAGAGDVIETKHLPPTLSLQYHFVNSSSLTPFVGIGVNYTHFFDEKGTGVLAGVPISLDDSWGFAAHAGVDIAISDRGSLRADVRWIDIDTSAKVAGAPIGSVKIDPIVIGAAYVFKF
jgi:outer membrane protein